MASIERGAPLHAAKSAALSNRCLPQNRAVPIRIHGVDDARFLARNQSRAAVWQLDQDWRRSEVEVRAFGLGTVRAHRVGKTAINRKRVAGRGLTRPEELAGLEIEGHERVGGARWRDPSSYLRS